MRAFGKAVAIAGGLSFVAACQTVAVAPRLPALPGNLASACRDPGVRVGKTVLGEFARNRQALAECNHKHRDTVRFYDKLRTGLGKR